MSDPINAAEQISARPGKPRILLLVDYRGWAFDNSAREIAAELRNDFSFDIAYVSEQPILKPARYDLVYVFFWGETYHKKFGFNPRRTIKEVSSHRWEDDPRFGPCKPQEMVARYLNDAATVICTSERLLHLISPWHRSVLHAPNGINPKLFRRVRQRCGSMTVGWAGNIEDPVKGIRSIVKPACEGRFELRVAPGGLSHKEMNDFYNQLDVIVVASKHEGEPLTLLEGMAAGAFPVCTDVGIVPELIRNGQNGLIVLERSAAAFCAALKWCECHLDQVRAAGKENEVLIHEQRAWSICARRFRTVFLEALEHAEHSHIRKVLDFAARSLFGPRHSRQRVDSRINVTRGGGPSGLG
ncbi:MAG TPA: glycosyltransferase [Verrucomicrobiota bacterium]|jgi:glycosyltransferase involved in cell wall biosynthesis|nr:MAG: Glycosyltransferase Gtf1 [Verrucomicrobia bacterium ADurb.Bin063]HNS70999.1 glycosyltransferase [Verrucomicrobiota bacterium]HNW06828.1 glycosyltransferase [Verrucomicrobiota bacterium]HOX63673.1 glycosyltransferase [Verrucomicrobiota bacterium]HPI63911.1 glycosyltransferase [Verrucomicrobiota bacterium]